MHANFSILTVNQRDPKPARESFTLKALQTRVYPTTGIAADHVPYLHTGYDDEHC
jgi:hypothetical protein